MKPLALILLLVATALSSAACPRDPSEAPAPPPSPTSDLPADAEAPDGADRDRAAVDRLVSADDAAAAAEVVDFDLLARLDMARAIAVMPTAEMAAAAIETGNAALASGGAERQRRSMASDLGALRRCIVRAAEEGDEGLVVPGLVHHLPGRDERAFFEGILAMASERRVYRLLCPTGLPRVVGVRRGRVISIVSVRPGRPFGGVHGIGGAIRGPDGGPLPTPLEPDRYDVIVEGPPGGNITLGSVRHPLPHRIEALEVDLEIQLTLRAPGREPRHERVRVIDPLTIAGASAPEGPLHWWLP